MVERTSSMKPRAVLKHHSHSSPFGERLLDLDVEHKVGRAVAKCKPQDDNAIFDCKVLSRSHAVIWFEEGKFYIKDTSSSNGTFVNNNRLSPANEDSPAREIYSNDIIQFGVEILDNATKITHGCIISRVKLFYPNGLEACKTPTMYNIPTENMLPAYYSYIQMLEKEQRIYQKLDDIEDVLQEAHLLADVTLLVKKKEELLMKELEVLQKTCDEETRHAQNLESKVEQLDGQLDRMVSEHEHDVIKLRSLSKMLKEKEIQEEHLQRRINSMIKSDHRLMTMLFLLLIIVFVIGGYDMIVVFSRLIY